MSKRLNHSLAIGIFLIGIFSANVSQAQTYTNVYWNPTTNGLGGTGPWGISTNSWSTNSTGGGTLTSSAALGANGIYNFSGTAGTVTNVSTITVGGINLLTSGYTFTGTSITYTGTDNTATGTNTIYITNNANLNLTGTGFKFYALAMTGGTGSTVTLTGLTGATNAIIFGNSSATSGRTNSVNTIISGAGTVVLGTSGANGFTQAGTISNTSSATLVLTNGGSGNVSVSGVVSGTGGLALNNASSGKIQLLAANTYSGATTLINTNGGEVQYSNAAAFGSGTITSSSAGTNYIRALAADLDLANAIAIDANNTLRVGATNTGWKANYSGVISGPGSVLFSYSGLMGLSGTNSSFGGGFVLGSSGRADLSKIGMAGQNSSIGTNGVIAAGTITTPSSKPTIRWVGTTNDTSDKVINIGNASGGLELQTLGNGDLTLNGNINSSGLGGPKTIFIYPYTNSSMVVGGVTNIVTNTLSLNGVINDGTPGFVVNDLSIAAGTNAITLASVAGVTSGASISGGACIANGTTISAVNTTTKVITLSQATTNSASISAGLAVMNVAGATAATSLTIQPKSSAASSYVNVVLGNTANSFSGGVLFTNSQSGLSSLLKISKFGNAGENSSLGTAANVTLGGASGATCTLDYTGSGAEFITNKSITLGGSVGTVGLSVSGTGSLKLGGGILPGNTSGARILSLTGSSAGTGEIAGAISDLGGVTSLTKSGSGTWTLSGNNTYTGTTTFGGGTTIISGDNSAAVGNVTISGGATYVRLENSSAISSSSSLVGMGATIAQSSTLDFKAVGNVTLNSYGVSSSSAGGSMNFTSSSGSSKTVTFTNLDNYITQASSGTRGLSIKSADLTLDFVGNIQNSSTQTNTTTFDGAGNFIVRGSLLDSTNATGIRTIAKTGAGTLTLLGASNNYSGSTLVSGGTLEVGAAGVLPSASSITVSSGATLKFNQASGGINVGSLTNEGTLEQNLITITSSGSVNLAGSMLKVNGTPTNSSYTLVTGTSLTGKPTLSPAIQQYELIIESSSLKLVKSAVTGSTFESYYAPGSEGVLGLNGLTNLMNYALGGTSPTSSPALPVLTSDANGLTLTANIRNDDASGLNVIGQYAYSLEGPWIDVTPLNPTGAISSVDKTTVRSFSRAFDENRPRVFMRFQTTK